jgi:hypothetical protein
MLPVEAEFFSCGRTDVRTDGHIWRPLIVAFRNFVNGPKNGANKPNRVLVSTIWGSHSFLLNGCPENLSRCVKWLQRKASRRLILSSVELEMSAAINPRRYVRSWPLLHSYLLVKGVSPRSGIFNVISRIPDLELRISLVMAWSRKSLLDCKKN